MTLTLTFALEQMTQQWYFYWQQRLVVRILETIRPTDLFHCVVIGRKVDYRSGFGVLFGNMIMTILWFHMSIFCSISQIKQF